MKSTRQKKFVNIIIIATLALLIIVVGIFIFVKLSLTPEKVRQTLVFELEKYLGREASISDVKISLFEGICLHGVVLRSKYPDEDQDFVRCEDVYIKFRYLPLLIKKLFVKELVLKNPKINFPLGTEGRMFPIGTQKREAYTGENPPLSVIFLPTHVEVNDGIIVFRSTVKGVSQPFVFSLEKINIIVSGISPIFSFPFSISAVIKGNKKSEISCNGKISVPKRNLHAEISIGKTPLSMWKQQFEYYGVPVRDGFVSARSKVELEKLKLLKLDGEVQIQDATWILGSSLQGKGDGSARVNDIDTIVHFVSSWDFTSGNIVFDKIDGTLLSEQFQGSGLIRALNKKPSLQLKLNAENFLLEKLFQRLPQDLLEPLSGLSLKGPADLTMKLKGRLNGALLPRLGFHLKGNRLAYPPLGIFQPDLEGRGWIDKGKIFLEDLKVYIRGSMIDVAGDILYSPGGTPKANLKVISSNIKFSDFFADTSGKSEQNEIGPFNFKGFILEGPISMKRVAFLGMRIDNLQGKYLLKNNKFFLKPLEGNIGKGYFNLSGSTDLGVRGLDYYLNLNVDDISLKSIVTMFSPFYRRFVEGALSGRCALKGSGTIPEHFKENLRGEGFFYIEDGLVKGLPFMKTLSSLLKIKELEELRFKQAQIQLNLQDGYANIDGAFLSPEIELYPLGAVGFDSSLNLDMTVKIAPGLTGKILSKKMRSYLPQENGWITVPVEIGGTIEKPLVSLNKDVLKIFMEKVLPEVLTDMMRSIKEKNMPAGASDEKQPLDRSQDGLQQ